VTDTVEGLVSTIIPVRNRPRELEEAVVSTLSQTYQPIEILIVDNASTDDTPETIRKLEAEHPQEIRGFQEGIPGPGAAREMGRLHARGEFIQYLDSDDLLEPEKFATQVALLRDRPECGVAYGRSRVLKPDGRIIDPARGTGVRRDTLFPHLLVDRWWCTHTPLYRRSVCDAVGAWSNLCYSQDWEYDARVGRLGTRLAYTEVLVSTHRDHAGPRQTGRGLWLTASERVVFFRSLLDCASEAGTVYGSPSMRHFSRWVFHHARQCATDGEVDAAEECLRLNERAYGRERWDVRVFRQASLILGSRRAARMASLVESLRPGRTGRDTQLQSWMNNDSDPKAPTSIS